MRDIEDRLARRAQDRQPSPIRELMPYLAVPGMISLGGGYPNPETFAFRAFSLQFKSGRQVVLADKEAVTACQYGPTPGHGGLLSSVLSWQRHKDGMDLSQDQVMMLTGSQEGLFIMAYLFLDAGDSVVLSEPAYPGALSAISAFCRNFVTVPLDDCGMQTDVLEARLGRMKAAGEALPKFIYTVPSGHNPGGVTLTLERRKHLLRIAEKYDLLILEDDPYQLVQIEGETKLPTIQALEGTCERVARLDSFSKILAPGLRVGYVSGSPELIRQFILFKQAANLHTSMLDQAMIHAFLDAHGFDGFQAEIAQNCAFYRKNRDAMVTASQEHLPKQVRFNIPRHGMFIWYQLPRGFDTRRMIREDCAEVKVVLVPGASFAVHSDLSHCMRASYAMVAPDEIDEGIKRFAAMMERERLRTISQ